MKDMLPEYIDELKGYDIDMLAHNLDRKAKDYQANDIGHAMTIIRKLLTKALNSVGITITKDSNEKNIDITLKQGNVKVEHRTNYKDDDIWRNGIYVYKNMDLIGFISVPLVKKPSFLEINKRPSIIVRSTV